MTSMRSMHYPLNKWHYLLWHYLLIPPMRTVEAVRAAMGLRRLAAAFG